MNKDNLLNFLNDTISLSIKLGATAADAICIENNSMSVVVRHGKLETKESSKTSGYGLRVFIGDRSSIISSSDFSSPCRQSLIEQALNMAKNSPKDNYSIITKPEDLCKNFSDLELNDNSNISLETMQDMAQECEEAALSHKGITNSEGASCSSSYNSICLATSSGFLHDMSTTNFGLSASVLAEKNGNKERDYDFSSKRFFADLDSAVKIGNKAALNTLQRLGAKSIRTSKIPVIFSPRIAKELIGSIISSINGSSIVKGTSFLKKHLNEKILPDNLSIINDPFIKRGPASKIFDAEGLATQKFAVVENGILKTWLLDLRSSAKLNLQSNACASRGLSSPPSPSCHNVYLEGGAISEDELISSIKYGIYITETFGMGINLVNGDYSQGAFGFLIENGKLTHPVNEITISGQLLNMLPSITACNNLEFKYSINSPTIMIEGMTIAGKG